MLDINWTGYGRRLWGDKIKRIKKTITEGQLLTTGYRIKIEKHREADKLEEFNEIFFRKRQKNKYFFYGDKILLWQRIGYTILKCYATSLIFFYIIRFSEATNDVHYSTNCNPAILFLKKKTFFIIIIWHWRRESGKYMHWLDMTHFKQNGTNWSNLFGTKCHL